MAERLRVYRCPRCPGEAIDGDLHKGIRFRGAAACTLCGKVFNVTGLDAVTNAGPLLESRQSKAKKKER